MKKLKSLLKEHAGKIELGDQPPAEQPILANLQKDLRESRETNNKYFRICVLMLVILFVVSVILVFVFLPDPKILAVVFGATGASLAWIINKMIQIWKEKSYLDLVIILCGTLKEDILKSIVGILAKKL